MAPRTPKEDPKLDFESSMRELEELVERLEQGELPLEESLAAFERGVMLTRSCQTALKDAEQKVEILLKKAGGPGAGEPGAGQPAAGAASIERFDTGETDESDAA
jgi:exodeoxyribonuclease VII small subunit